ncbi:MAG: hypothetical protein II643_02150, partial [Oscillospiraceae bacterium]|nr:hypothetical protein [Oscillospiraceae bacterium]
SLTLTRAALFCVILFNFQGPRVSFGARSSQARDIFYQQRIAMSTTIFAFFLGSYNGAVRIASAPFSMSF